MPLGVFVEILSTPGGTQVVPGVYLGALGATPGGTWGGLGNLWGRLGVAPGAHLPNPEAGNFAVLREPGPPQDIVMIYHSYYLLF